MAATEHVWHAVSIRGNAAACDACSFEGSVSDAICHAVANLPRVRLGDHFAARLCGECGRWSEGRCDCYQQFKSR
jgi:hypothetical protein